MTVEAGNEYTVTFKAADLAAYEGYQFTLDFDRRALEFVGIEYGTAGVQNIGLSLLEKGNITVSWDNSDLSHNFVTQKETTAAFSIVFRAMQSAQMEDLINISSAHTKAEAYTIHQHTTGVALTLRDVEDNTTGATFMLRQNYPNPVKHTTTIGFELPYDGIAALVFHDVSGRVLARVAGEFAKGQNQVVMDGGFPDGLVYYTLTMYGYTATKQMIVIAD